MTPIELAAYFLAIDHAPSPPEDIIEVSARSPRWNEVREDHLSRHPVCEACHTQIRREVHHVVPFWSSPELELEKTNLITLCRAHHFHLGHDPDGVGPATPSWRAINANCRADVAAYRRWLDETYTGYWDLGAENGASLAGSIDVAIADRASLAGSIDIAIADRASLAGSIDIAIADRASLAGWIHVAIGDRSAIEGWNHVSIGDRSSRAGWIHVTIGDRSALEGWIHVSIGDRSSLTGWIHVTIGDRSSLTWWIHISIGDRSSLAGWIHISIGDRSSLAGKHRTSPTRHHFR